jgi:ADP-heptose:LPS heptosyltransferase
MIGARHICDARLGRVESLEIDRDRSNLRGAILGRIARLRRWKSVLDCVARLTPRRFDSSATNPRRIGVMFQWGIGDAVLALPLLKALASAYPGASIEPIGKPWLAELFAGEPWLGATHELVPPWTRPSRKYRLWDREWRRYAAQLLALRKTRFDLLIGIRLDPREVVQLRLLNAARTVGVVVTGGEAWLTDPVALTSEDYYFRYRAEYTALAARQLTGCEVSSQPHLEVDDAARAAALARLRASGYADGPIVCVHNGAGNPIREWRPASFATVLDSVRDLVPFVVVIDDGVDPSGPRLEVPDSVVSTVWKSGLRELKALLSVGDVLLCCDSGVMHMGAACGCRVVAIFGAGSIYMFAPRGERHQIVKVDQMPCRPCFDSCIYPSPICMDGINESAVSAALRRSLDAALSGRALGSESAIQRVG